MGGSRQYKLVGEFERRIGMFLLAAFLRVSPIADASPTADTSPSMFLKIAICGNHFARACEFFREAMYSSLCRLFAEVHHSLPRSAESCGCAHHCSLLRSLSRSPPAGVSPDRRLLPGEIYFRQYRPCRLQRIPRRLRATGPPRSPGRRPMRLRAPPRAHGPEARRLPAASRPARSRRAAAILSPVPAPGAVRARR